MAEFDTVIRGGTLATASEVFEADIGIRDGRIVAHGQGLKDADQVIDADGLYVVPGGIDSHVHLAQPTSDGSVIADDFVSGTRSAACGGNTTVIPFALQARGQSLREAVADYHKKADGQSYVDYSFHLIVTDPSEQVLGQEVPALVADGYTSLKIFMTYDDMKLNDRQIFEVLDTARRTKALVLVHAENYDAIKIMTERLEREGRTEPQYHAASRPPAVEREATHRAISFAELAEVPLVVVHVSCRDSMEQIRWARERGLRIYGETCPQYLVLTAEDLEGLNMEGSKYVCSPPPRDEASQQACWEGIQTGVFSVFSSDHCPYRYEGDTGKQIGTKSGRTAFRWVPNGIPGVETRLPILFSEGVSKGRIDICRFVALSSTHHARMYGLHPRKGTLAVGADADIALWDPKKKVTLSQSIMNHGCDYTPFEGIEITGYPVLTMVRGHVVSRDARPVDAAPGGQFLKRDPSPLTGAGGLLF